MRAKVKTARRKASKLHGAVAGYVSIVDRGASETPFALIKSAKGEKAVAIKKRSKAAKSHKKVNSGRKGAQTAVRKQQVMAKMVFDGDVFEDEEAVRDALKEAEWEGDLTVVQNSEGDWEARPKDTTDDDFLRLAKVDTETDGVEAYVGEQEVNDEDEDDDEDDDDASTETKSEDDTDDEDDEDAEGEEDDEDAEDEHSEDDNDLTEKSAPKTTKKSKTKTKTKKTEQLSKRAAFVKSRKSAKQKEQKFDAWDARFSGSNTLAKALKAGMEWDGTPPGYYEVQAAFNGVVGSIVGDEGLDISSKQEALNKSALEYAEVIGGLDAFFDQYVNADEETVAKVIEDEKVLEAIQKWAGEYADFVADPAVAPQPEKTEKAAGEPAAIDYNKLSKSVAELVSKAVEPLNERVEAVSGTLEALSKRRPTKKAADPEEVGRGAPETSKEKEAKSATVHDLRTRAIFGG